MKIPMVENSSNDDSGSSDGHVYVHHNEGESFEQELDNCCNNNMH